MRILGLAIVLALLVGQVGPLAAEQPAAGDTAEVAKLQQQLATMQRQMEEMQKTIDAAKLPADQRQQMMGNMGMMRNGWQGMHGQCCMMNPAACPGMQPAPPR